jgi:signal transduction histidine kinase
VQLIKSGYEEIIGLQRLTENLMELTRQQKQKNSIPHGDVSLLEIIEAALKNVVPLAKQKHIVIQQEIDDYILDGESSSLTELFTILLDNAIKYSPNKTQIKIASRKSNHHIDITVTDQGIGMDEKDLPHIFDRFYRADKSRSKISGYGLGLSIAKEIVKSHNGTLTVESKPEKGTTFTVQLPLRKTA